VDLLLRPMGPFYARAVLLGLAGLGLAFPAVLRAPITWLGLTAGVGTCLVADWPLSDNHIYLLVYWCLAVVIALRTGDPPASLGASARLLLGAAFALAVAWKVVSPDYLDGRFFRVTLLTDDRFAETALLLGGLSGDDLDHDRKALEPLPEGAELMDPPRVREPARFRALAAACTWGGLALEVAVAALHLVPGPLYVLARHLALLLFGVATYAVAPVAGFGWLLAVMGLAGCRPGQRGLRTAYGALFFVVLFYSEVPWPGLLNDWLD
jgi:hypothetical protein